PVHSVAPTLIQEVEATKTIEQKREELASMPGVNPLTENELAELRAIGDNTNCMRLKGASPDNPGEMLPDSWPVSEQLKQLAERWAIEPKRQLTYSMG
ncbi:MAG TPA: aldo/keto reductase, partial [Solirubrobacterales bacterium]|nr:aldo/keto reductase [Solirubrobacterales bacterium]